MSDTHFIYDESFYRNQSGKSLRSAEVIAPLVIEVFSPRKVIDIGCGVGTFLCAFQNCGVEIKGYDGNTVSPDLYYVDQKYLVPGVDFSQDFSVEKGDVSICLEVVEHLANDVMDSFFDTLTECAPVALFSGATPGQGGSNHINEQHHGYWAELFSQRGFIAVDMIRPQIWTSPEVSWWYKQNVFVYVKKELVEQDKALQAIAAKYHPDTLGRLTLISTRYVENPLSTIRSVDLIKELALRVKSRLFD